jgi:hypothetical protein
MELAERLALRRCCSYLPFFLGLAFEGNLQTRRTDDPGGIRTFPLVGLAGAMLYLIEPHWLLAFGAGLLAIGEWLDAFLRLEPPTQTGKTLVVPGSNLLVYALGPIACKQSRKAHLCCRVGGLAAERVLGSRFVLLRWH